MKRKENNKAGKRTDNFYRKKERKKERKILDNGKSYYAHIQKDLDNNYEIQ